MSTNIDERIVELRFDNDQFEKGTAETIKSLEKLKNSLELEDAEKSLKSFQTASDNFNPSGIERGVNSIVEHMSIAGTMISRFAEQITDDLYRMGKNMVMDLSFDQIDAGFSKYEEKTKAVQTIMNATGLSIDKVSESLDKLNWFTDETSYSFLGMVNNIGKFTNNGIALDTAVTSMIGIADAAGLAGASVQDASHAMDGFSKAMAKGYMDRQNWTWLRTAHMDTQAFKEELISAAESLGTLVYTGTVDGQKMYRTMKKNEVSANNFEDALKDGWMTVDVMNKALAAFGGTTEELYKLIDSGAVRSVDKAVDLLGKDAEDLGLKAFLAAQEAKTFGDAIEAVKDAVSTQWMTTFEYLFGNYEQAKSLWTDFANEMWDIFAENGDRRNTVLKAWADSDARDAFVNGLYNSFHAIESVIFLIQDALGKIFPPLTFQRLSDFSYAFERISGQIYDAVAYVREEFNVDEALAGYEQIKNEVTEIAEESVLASNELTEMAKKVITGAFGHGGTRKNNLEELGMSYAVVQNKVNELLDCEVRHEYTQEDLARTAEALGIANVDLSVTVDELTESLEEQEDEEVKIGPVAKNLKSTLDGLIAVIKIGVGAFGGIVAVLEPFGTLIANGAKAITGLTGSFGEWLVQTEESLISGGKLSEWFSGIASTINDVLGPAMEKLNGLFDAFTKRDFSTISQPFEDFKEKAKPVLDVVKTIGKVLGAIVVGPIYLAYIGIKKFIDVCKELNVLDTIMSNVSEGFEKLKNWFKPLTNDFTQFTSLFDKVKGDGENLTWPERLANKLVNLSKEFKLFAESFSQNVKKLRLENLLPKNVLDTLGGLRKQIGLLKNVPGWFDAFGEDAKVASVGTSTVTDTFYALIEVVKGLYRTAIDYLGPLGTFIDTIVQYIVGTVSAGLETAKRVFDEVGLAEVLRVVLTILSIIAVFNFSKIASGIGYVTEAIGDLINGIKTNILASAAVQFAISIALVAGALYVLATYVEPGRLLMAITAIAIIGVILGALIVVSGKFASLPTFDIKKLGAIIGGILALAIGIAVVGYSLTEVAKMSWGAYLSALLKVALVIGALIGVYALFGKLNLGVKTLDLKSFLALLGFASAVQQMVKAFIAVQGLGLENIGKAFVSLAAIVTIMIGMLSALSKIKLSGAYQGILVATSIYMFAMVLKRLGDMHAKKEFESIKGAFMFIGSIIALLGIILYSFSKIMEQTKGLNIGFGPLLAIAFDILAIGLAIKLISTVDFNDVVVGAAVIGGILAVMGLVLGQVKYRKYVDSYAGTTTLFASFAVLLLVIVGVLVLMTSIVKHSTPGELAGATVIIIVLMLAIGAVIKAMNNLPKLSFGNAASLLAVGALLVMMTFIFKTFASFADDENLNEKLKLGGIAVLAGVGLIIAIMVVFTVLSHFTAAAIPGIVAVILVLAIIVAAVIEMAVTIEKLGNAVSSIMTAMEEIGEMDSGKIALGKSVIKSIFEMLKEFMLSMGDFKGPLMMESVESAANAVATLVSCIEPLKDVSDKEVENAKTQMRSIFGFLKEIYKWFNEEGGSVNFIKIGSGNMFVEVSDGIKRLIPSVKELKDIGDVDKVIKLMEGLGVAYKKFGEAIGSTPLFFSTDRAKSITSLVESTNILVEGITKIVASEIKLTDATQAMKDIGIVYEELGKALDGGGFFDNLTIQDRANAVTTVVGSIDELGKGLKSFHDQIKWIGPNDASNTIQILGEAIAAIVIELKDSNGEDGKGIERVVKVIDELGENLYSFYENVTKIDPNYVWNTLDILGKSLSKVASAVADAGFLNFNETGGDQIVAVVGSLSQLATAVSILGDMCRSYGIDNVQKWFKTYSDAITNFASAASLLNNQGGNSGDISEVIKMLPELSNAVRDVTNEGISGTTFRTQITEIAKAIYEFIEILNDGHLLSSYGAKAKYILDAADSIKIMTEAIQILSTMASSTVDNRINSLTTGLTNIGTAVKSFGESTDAIYSFRDVISSITDMIRAIGDDNNLVLTANLNGYKIVKAIADGFKDGEEYLKSACEAFTSRMLLYIRPLDGETYIQVGVDIVGDVKKGMDKSHDTVKIGAQEVIKAASKAMLDLMPIGNPANNQFYQAGVNATNGFAVGMLDDTAMGNVRSSAVKIAQDALAALEGVKGIDSHSPSKKTTKDGKNFSFGFAGGMIEAIGSVTTAAEAIADAALNVVADTSTVIAQAINDEFDTEFKIRPVLDLTGVRRSAGMIDSMINADYARNVTASIASTNSTSQQTTGDIPAPAGNSYTFIQNNTSPKALSRLDIYRESKNLFAQLKGV